MRKTRQSLNASNGIYWFATCPLHVIIFSITFILQGCVGAVELRPKECKANLPLNNYVYTKDDWGPPIIFHKSIKEDLIKHGTNITKEKLIADWGNPKKIVTNNDNTETWIYEHKMWCGVGILIMIFPIPLRSGPENLDVENRSENICDHFDDRWGLNDRLLIGIQV